MALDFVEYQDSVTDTSGDKYEPLQEEIEENERSILLKSCHSVPPHGSVFPALITAPQLPSSSDNVSFVLHQHSYNFGGKIIRSNWLSLGVSTYTICMGLYRLITPIGIMYSILLETVNIEFFSFIAVTESYGGMCMCLQDGGGQHVCLFVYASMLMVFLL